MKDTVLIDNLSLRNKSGYVGWSIEKSRSDNSWQQSKAVKAELPAKIILDTDYGDDGHDLAALAVLHHLADLGEVELLAVGQSDSRCGCAGRDRCHQQLRYPIMKIRLNALAVLAVTLVCPSLAMSELVGPWRLDEESETTAAAKDGYVYIYSPEGAHAHKLLLARVRKDKLGVRSEWEYFVRYDNRQEPVWTHDLTRRGYVHVFPEKSSDGNCFGW